MFGVNNVKDHICISLVTCSENDKLEQLCCPFEAFKSKWADIDTSGCNFAAGKPDLYQLINTFVHVVLDTVNQSLIQVKHDGLRYPRLLERRQ